MVIGICRPIDYVYKDKKSFELIHAELVVHRKELLTPHYMRVYLTGERFRYLQTQRGCGRR